jgi:hypothetical protein
MSPIAEWVVACALMPAAGFALLGVRRAARLVDEARRQAPPSPPPPVPVDRLLADLRRLRAALEETETRDGLMAKHHRVQALRGAYLDVLSAACRQLDVTPPSSDHAPLAEIYRVEATLRQRGLDVRECRPPAAQGPGAARA